MPSDVNSMASAASVADYFDGLYGSEERYWWREGDPYSLDPNDYPTSLLTQVTLRLLDSRRTGKRGRRTRRALDLGAGEGADSIRLARLGYDVTAVDISPRATKKISEFVADAGVDVNVETANIGEYRPEGSFDVIILNGVLHYTLDKGTIIDRMQAATRPGGLHIVSAWSSYTPAPACHNSIPVYCDDEDGVIVRAYRNWDLKLLYFERNKAEQSHTGMPPHSHSHIKVIAERPGP